MIVHFTGSEWCDCTDSVFSIFPSGWSYWWSHCSIIVLWGVSLYIWCSLQWCTGWTNIYTLSTHYLHNIYKLSTHYLHTINTLSTHYLFTIYTLSKHNLFTIYTLSTQSQYLVQSAVVYWVHTPSLVSSENPSLEDNLETHGSSLSSAIQQPATYPWPSIRFLRLQ